MIVDPTDPRQGITPSGKSAARVFWAPLDTAPTGDLSDFTFVGLTDLEQAATPEPCEHHWVSAHQADFPPGIQWVRQCSQCHRIDGADLTIQMDKATQTVMLPIAEQDERGGGCV